MTDDKGVYWVSVGEKAKLAQTSSLMCLRDYGGSALAYRAQHMDGTRYEDDPRKLSRWLKLSILDFTSWPQILYLDADAWPRTSMMSGFDILSDGFDLVIGPSLAQSSDWCWHVGPADLGMTEHLRPAVALQGGMWWVQRNDRTKKFFEIWKEEWLKEEGQDQAALLRALQRRPLSTWLLSQERFVNHRYGAARVGPR